MPPKRRRKDTPVEPAEVPAEVASSDAVEVQRVVPNLDNLAKLLLVDMQQDDLQQATAALSTLWNEISDLTGDELRQANYKKQMRLGAPSLIALCMQKWQNESSVQAKGCGCLAELLHRGHNNLNETGFSVFAAVKESGCIEAVINALRTFPDSAEIQEVGCRALMNVTTPIDDNFFPSNIRRLVNEMDVVALTLKVVERFPNSPQIQETCCGMFSNLAEAEEFRPVMQEQKVVSVVAHMIEKYPDNGDIKAWGGFFMRSMFAQTD